MDEYSVKLMNRALHDLDDIYGYIAKTFLELGTEATIRYAKKLQGDIPVIEPAALKITYEMSRWCENQLWQKR